MCDKFQAPRTAHGETPSGAAPSSSIAMSSPTWGVVAIHLPHTVSLQRSLTTIRGVIFEQRQRTCTNIVHKEICCQPYTGQLPTRQIHAMWGGPESQSQDQNYVCIL